MSDLSIPATATQQAIPRAGNPAGIHDAAQQFEALLIGQILESVTKDGGWLGSGEDAASSCAGGFAQQQLAIMMAKQGGIGLASMIEKGLLKGSAALSPTGQNGLRAAATP